MQKLKTALKNKLQNPKRVAILGIGSDLNADDAAGMLVARCLHKDLKKRRSSPACKVFYGETAPENLTGEIKKFKPTHVVMIDAADFGRKSGEVVLIDASKIEGISFSTHRLPATIIAEYLIGSLGCQVVIIGIQPKSLVFGSLPSKEIKKAAASLVSIFKEVLGGGR